MYYSEEHPGELKKKDGTILKYNSEQFLRVTGEWPWKTNEDEVANPHKLIRMSGKDDLVKLDKMFEGIFNAWGCSVDRYGREVKLVNSPENIPPTLFAQVPDLIKGNGSYLFDSNNVPISTLARVNPYTAETALPSIRMLVVEQCMEKGEIGPQTRYFLHTGPAIVEAEGQINKVTLLKDSKYTQTYEIPTKDNKIDKHEIKLTLSQDTQITYDVKNSAYKDAKGKPFAFVRTIEVNVPYAIAWTFRNNAPYSHFFYTYDDYKKVKDYVTSGEEVTADFGKDYQPLSLGTETRKLWHPDFVTMGKDKNGETRIIPAVVEYARLIKNPQNLPEDKIYGYVVDENGYRVVVGAPPVGGVEELTPKTIELRVNSDVVARVTKADAQMEQLYNELQKYFDGVEELATKAHDIKLLREVEQLKDKVYKELPQKQEELRINADVKVYMESVIKQFDVSLTERIAYLKKQISEQNTNLATALASYNAALALANEGVVYVQDNINRVNAAIASYDDLIKNSQNAGLRDYYTELKTSAQNELTYWNQEMVDAKGWQTKLQEAKDPGVDEIYDMNTAKENKVLLNDRLDRATALLAQKESWYKDTDKMLSGWINESLKEASEGVTDAQKGVTYFTHKIAIASSGLGDMQRRISQAATQLVQLNSELNV